jgi:hypothetical protein
LSILIFSESARRLKTREASRAVCDNSLTSVLQGMGRLVVLLQR